MKLLYCHVDFYNKAGEPGDFRRLHDIDLNLSPTHVFSYDSKNNALSARLRDKPLPENFWANGDDKTNLYNINVVAGSNGSGKSTIINYLIDLLYYIYLDYGAETTNIPDSARFDVSPNHNLMVFEEAKKLYVLDHEPSGKKKKSRVKCLFDGKDKLSPLPEGIEACDVIHGGRDKSRAAKAFNKCIKGMKVIYMMNNPTQRDYERNLQRQSGGLRSYFVYDCSLGANLGGGTAQFFPYEVYKQVRYLFDGNQMNIRDKVRKLIGNDPDKNDEFVMPAALRIRPRIDMLNDGAAQKLLPSLKDFDPENAEEKKAFINNTALNELLGALCCRAFAENAAGIFKKDAKTAVADAAEYLGSVPREHGSPFCEQERAIHAAANAAFTPPYIQEDSRSTCIAALPGGRVVVGYYDSTLRVWDAASGKCLKTLEGHGGLVNCVAVLKDGRVVSGSADNNLRVWDAASGQCLKTLEGHGGPVYCVAALDDGRVVSGSLDRTLRVWDADAGHCLKILEEHGGPVYCVAALDDGRVVSGSPDRTLRVWDAASGQCLKTLKGHGGWVTCVAVLKDGRVVSGSRDNTLRVWDADAGLCLKTLKGHGDAVSCLAALDDGRVVSGSYDNTLRVWDAVSGQCLKTLEGHGDAVSCLAALDDGRVVSGSWDETVRIWDMDTFGCIDILSADPGCMLLNKIRHYGIDYIGFLVRNGEYFTAGDDGQYAGFRRVDGEDCCYEIPLKTNGGDEEAREKLYSFMTEFIQKYRYTCEPVYTVDFDWGLSSGEENMLRMFSNLFHVFTRDFSSGNYGECRIYNDEFRMDEYNETDECSSVMLFLDEADLTLHPEWQRRLIRLLTAFLPSIYPETCVKDMQLVLSTHSPLLLGDIPSENICYLGKDNNEPGETFGQNIHTILRDGFFLESGTVGAFAGARINGIADRLEEIIENEGKKKKTDGEEVLKNEGKNKNAKNKPYIRPSEKELADIRKTIDIVANGILRVWLEGKWLETNAVLSEPLCSEEAKKLVEEAKKLPPEEKRYILRELLGEDGK